MKQPIVLERRLPRYVTVFITIDNVEYMCPYSEEPVRARIEITYVTRGALLEYRSLERYVHEVAKTKKWLTEELAVYLAITLTKLLDTYEDLPQGLSHHVRVAIEHQETPSTHVRVTA